MPGLIWLIAAIATAGIVRGFSGFGTALVFVPVAGMFLPPQVIIGVITLTGVASNAALLPRAWRQADRAEIARLALPALITIPIGIWLIDQLDPVSIRWLVAGIATVTLTALISGWRLTGEVNKLGLSLIGAMSGIIGGLTGLTGPMVILFYLAGQRAAQSIRANTILFLAILDVVVVSNLLLQGSVDISMIWLALTLAVPYFITSLIGQALFKPGLERFYRLIAYAIIALAVLSGLPIWE